MSLLRPMIVDDQDKRVRLASMLAPGSPSRRKGLWTFVGLPLVAVVFSLVVAISLMGLVDLPTEMAFWIIAVAVAIFVAGVVVGLEIDWWRENGRIYLKEHMCCAGCAYDLADVSTDRFGNTICPECGATWKLPGKPPQR